MDKLNNWNATVILTASIPKFMLMELDKLTEKYHQSRSELVREAIAVFLNKNKRGLESNEVAKRT